jgi:hypothetical protein
MVPRMHEGRAMKNVSLASLAVLLLGAHVAHAQAPGDTAPPPPVAPAAGGPMPVIAVVPPEAPPPRPLPSVAITISPFHFFLPVIELTGELRIGRKLGIAVIAGAGKVTATDSNVTANVYEGGASVRYYVLGNFRHGMQIGGELLYVKATATDTSIDVRGKGFGISPFLGYKWTHHSGFTIDTQLGVTYIAVEAESSTQMKQESKVGPMLNLNVGWSI